MTGASRPLRVVVLASGTATMALQLAMVRLMSPWVGASTFVWATVIGLSLLAMSLGYVLGGRLADRVADGRVLARTLGGAGLLVAAIPVVAPLLLPHVDLGISDPVRADVVGSAIAYGVLAMVPAVLLGITPPYAIRIALTGVAGSGRTAGGLYALSTVGSIVGTLLTGLVLVQWIGTRATLWSIAALLLVAAVIATRVRAHATATEGEPAQSGEHGATGTIALGFATIIVLVEGAAMMATEMSIARLVAPFFGASHVVWAIIIATVMGSIAVGSRVGGRCADRWPSLPALAMVLGAAALAIALLPFAASPVMRVATRGIDDVAVVPVVGSFLATMALLVVPVLLLGMVPPWVLRLSVSGVEGSGGLAGRLYAASTVGALVGTFASVLWLIPAIGTRRTMLVLAAVLAVLGLALTLRADRARRTRGASFAAATCVVVGALAFAPTGLVKPLDGERVLQEDESRYQFIQVIEQASGRRVLQLNEGWAIHSVWEADTALTGGYWDHFLVLPALTEGATDGAAAAGRMLVIGNAAGTTMRAFARHRPDIDVTGVELDPEVTRAGRRWFELEGRVETADGRPFLRRTSDRWDVIEVDAYRQPYIPFYMATEEFFELAKSRLAPGGVVAVNVGSTPSDDTIDDAIAATMRVVFPTVVRYRAETYNDVIVGVTGPAVPIETLRDRVLGSTTARDPDLAFLFEGFAAGMRDVAPAPDRVLTDDRAPVEWMTDRMVFGEAR